MCRPFYVSVRNSVEYADAQREVYDFGSVQAMGHMAQLGGFKPP
jgi:hypothetical protein